MAKQLNPAQQLLAHLGVAIGESGANDLSPSSTKRGPGRKARHGKTGTRLTKTHKTRAYVALMAAWASKRVTKAPLRDEHGAYTLIGSEYEVDGANPTSGEHVIRRWKGPDEMGYTARRKWLGGVSERRGF